MKLFFTRKGFLMVSLITILLIGGFLFNKFKTSPKVVYQTAAENDPYVRFEMEAYDKITKNYWNSPSQYDLSNFFKLAVEKAGGTSVTLATSTRSATADMLAGVFKNATSTEARKNLALNVVSLVLYNLQPIGRNGLLSQAQETAFRQNVSNVDPSKDLYQNLGLEKGATPKEINQAYEQKAAVLEKATTTEAEAELKAVAYARSVLTNPNSKQLYDEAKIEPTVFSRVMGRTLYLYLNKISPTTLREFALSVDSASTTPGLDSMILDLRSNVGGSLDFLQNFLGIFIGQNQYAFDLFHQGNYDVQRTVQPKFDELKRFKDIAILTDNMTQSTAELTAATFKKFNLAHVVGVPTRGWGTVENTYPLETDIDPANKYLLLLVNSVTLRDDNQSIEGQGVEPDINTNDSNWKTKLKDYFHSQSLIQAVSESASKLPVQ
ncbi:MAG: S41 family peptidase [Minisyncoccota bacterium]